MSDACTRCQEIVTTRTPSEGVTQQIGMIKTTVTWRLRFRRFHWVWLPENPMDRVSEFYTTLDLCDWCAGDVFLFAQGLPPRAKQSACSGEDQEERYVCKFCGHDTANLKGVCGPCLTQQRRSGAVDE